MFLNAKNNNKCNTIISLQSDKKNRKYFITYSPFINTVVSISLVFFHLTRFQRRRKKKFAI